MSRGAARRTNPARNSLEGEWSILHPRSKEGRAPSA